jgi:hypothetical protein
VADRDFTEKRFRRQGHGTRTDLWRYWPENEDDACWDPGELPPIRGLLVVSCSLNVAITLRVMSPGPQSR